MKIIVTEHAKQRVKERLIPHINKKVNNIESYLTNKLTKYLEKNKYKQGLASLWRQTTYWRFHKIIYIRRWNVYTIITYYNRIYGK